MLKKQPINTVFYVTLLSVLLFLTASHAHWGYYPPLFFLNSALQNVAEVSLYLLAGCLFNRWWVWGSCFFLLLFHYVDFLIVHLRGATIVYFFKYLLGDGPVHMIAAFKALSLNTITLVMIAVFIPAVFLIGAIFYRITYGLSQKLCFQVAAFHVAACSFFLIGSAAIADYWSSQILTPAAYNQYARALPWGKTLFSSKSEPYALCTPPTKPHSSSIFFSALKHRPNIYLFVIESLRKDSITASISPNLWEFGKNWGNPEQSFSNANSTAPAWFSIFYSSPAYNWTSEQVKEGSSALRHLKEMGYQIRAYLSADLRYCKMDEALFGRDKHLLNHLEEYGCYDSLETCDRDILALARAKKDLLQAPNSTVFLFFLDGTHSEYSVPKNWKGPFQPIIEKINYLSIHPKSPELEGLKNRYRNAIFFLDAQLGSFFASLKKQNLFDEAIIAITGDHGEEFFEEGALFHGSHLNTYQTSIPIFLKAGSWPIKASLATQIDLFPSIFQFLTGEIPPSFSGQSLFAPVRNSRIAVSDNGINTPQEFLIEEGPYRFQARFTADPQILEIIENNWDANRALPFLTAPEQILGEQTAQSQGR